MQQAITQLAPLVGVSRACQTLGVPHSAYYRACSPRADQPLAPPKAPEDVLALPPPVHRHTPRALSEAERDQICALLNSARFADLAPREIYATFRRLCLRASCYRAPVA